MRRPPTKGPSRPPRRPEIVHSAGRDRLLVARTHRRCRHTTVTPRKPRRNRDKVAFSQRSPGVDYAVSLLYCGLRTPHDSTGGRTRRRARAASRCDLQSTEPPASLRRVRTTPLRATCLPRPRSRVGHPGSIEMSWDLPALSRPRARRPRPLARTCSMSWLRGLFRSGRPCYLPGNCMWLPSLRAGAPPTRSRRRWGSPRTRCGRTSAT